MIKLSIFENFKNSNVPVTLEEMVFRIKNGIYGQWIRPLRRMLKEGNKEGYDQGKKKLVAMTISALINGARLMPNVVEYTREMGLDFDKLSEEELPRVKKIIIECDYTHVCFISPSGNGLKVLVSVSTGIEEHLSTFLSLQRYYTALTGVKIDPSGKDVTRLCFVSDDPELYYNPGATIYVPLCQEGKMELAAKPLGSVSIPAETTTDFDKYRRCVAYVESFSTYTEGQRNDYIYSVALKMFKDGLSEQYAEMMLTTEYDLGEREIKSCVKSAFGHNLPGVSTSLNDRGGNVDSVEKATDDGPPSPKPPWSPQAKRRNPRGSNTP